MIQVSLIREPSYSLIEERANKPPPKMTCTNFLDHVLFFLDLVPNGKGFSKSGRVLNKIPGRGSGLGRVGVSEFMIGYFWVSFLLLSISGYLFFGGSEQNIKRILPQKDSRRAAHETSRQPAMPRGPCGLP